MKKQVDKNHYRFSTYVGKRRWASIWHQLDEVLSLDPEEVLEIGPGPGIFKALASAFGVRVETLDIDPDLRPDHLGSAEDMPFDDDSYDIVCAFQMLEHVPYQISLKILREMSRVARRHIVISLPDARPAWPYSFHIPAKGDLKFIVPFPRIALREHFFDGEHYWEVNKKGHSLKKVISDLVTASNANLTKTFRVKELPYHRFFILAHD